MISGESVLIGEPGYAAGAVAAHFPFAAVGVKEVHVYVRIVPAVRVQEHDAVCADSRPSGAERLCCLAHLVRRNAFAAVVHDDKIVACTVHFRKFHGIFLSGRSNCPFGCTIVLNSIVPRFVKREAYDPIYPL